MVNALWYPCHSMWCLLSAPWLAKLLRFESSSKLREILSHAPWTRSSALPPRLWLAVRSPLSTSDWLGSGFFNSVKFNIIQAVSIIYEKVFTISQRIRKLWFIFTGFHHLMCDNTICFMFAFFFFLGIKLELLFSVSNLLSMFCFLKVCIFILSE